MKTYRPFLMIALLVVSMLACNISVNSPAPTQDSNLAYTAAAQTVSAQLTNAALSQPAPLSSPTLAPSVEPSSTLPAPTIAPATVATLPSLTPVSACDRAEFVIDVTVADNTTMTPDQDFTKTWRLRNTGTCSWTPSYSVVYSSGAQMSGPSVQALTGNVNPGQTVDISVDMTAPTAPGAYRGDWKLRNASGVTFFGFYVQIIVSSGGGGGSAAFTVTAVNYLLGTWSSPGFVNCPRVTAYITTNGAGTITYHWRRSDGDDPEQTLSFPAAGTKSINADWARGSFWAGTNAWLGIYIDDPNNQDFGHLNFTSACTSP